jgi:hypothetical protein
MLASEQDSLDYRSRGRVEVAVTQHSPEFAPTTDSPEATSVGRGHLGRNGTGLTGACGRAGLAALGQGIG